MNHPVDSRITLAVLACCSATVLWLFLHRSQSVQGHYAATAAFLAIPTLYATISWKYSTDIHGAPFLVLILLVTFVATIAVITMAYRLSPFHPLAQYPGPRLWCITNLSFAKAMFTGHRHRIVDALHARYGPVVRIGPNTISINTRSSIPVLYGWTSTLEKSDDYLRPGRPKGVCLFFKQTNHAHSQRKKVWTAGLSNSSIQDYIPHLVDRTSELLRCLDHRQVLAGGFVNLSECICQWSYDLGGDLMYGACNDYNLMHTGDPGQLVETGKQGMIFVDSLGSVPWLMDILWRLPAGGAADRYRKLAASMMHNRIRKDGETTTKDLSSYLLADMKSGGTIPVTDLEWEATNALFGGGDTIAGMVTLLFAYLLRSPQYYARLYEELSAHFSPSDDLDMKTLSQIEFLGAVIDEALRLESTFYFPRLVPAGGLVIDDHVFPEGTIISTPIYSQHTSPLNFYPHPLEFRPERWLPSGLGAGSICERSAFLAFATGSHVCVGKAFAYAQMRYLVSRIVLTYDMSFVDGFDPHAFLEGTGHNRTVRLRFPLLVTLKARKSQ